jgi:hypothetical protein
MVAPRRPAASVTIELTVGVFVFEVAIDGFAPWARGSAARRRFHDDERRLVLLGHLGRRQPGLLQRRELAEQRLL